mgnify:FL=1|tara:strand:+ start:2065 stop:2664 length:600 start_codon:yes stop_codon:yes gene_type:complete
MQDQITNNEGLKIMQEGIASAPIAGQSLTNSKDTSYAWESPPQMTKVKEGIHHVFNVLIEPAMFKNTIDALDAGVPVLDISSSILYEGFETGKWTPDLMLLLQEPTMYMVIAMGEKAGLDKIRIYAGEEKDDGELYAEDFKKVIDEETTFQSLKPTTISKSSIPVEIQEQIENIEPSSLLSKPNIEENRSSNLSLLERN